MAVKGEKRRLGFWGETRACRFLKKRGFKIVERNFRCPFGEVDIVAEKGGVTAFIEVKTRTSDYFGAPNEAVDERRKQRYRNAVRFYYANRQIDCTVRFDIIEVTNEGINHIENAFY